MSAQGMGVGRQLVERARLLVYRAGFEVSRETFKRRFVHSLDLHGIDSVLDIGANTGQFGTLLRRSGFAGHIVSVEPLGDAFTALRRAIGSDDSWTAERAAVADQPGTLTVNVAANSVSSSVLPMAERHAKAAPQSRYVATEKVPATTVDELVARHGLRPEQTLLKIDVQGYEQPVLDGARATLAWFGAVRTEMSLVPLYEGQALMPKIVHLLTDHGFDLWLIEPGFVEPGTGRLLQVDGVFFRSSS